LRVGWSAGHDVGVRDLHVGADVLRRAAATIIEALARMLVYIADAKVDEPLRRLIEICDST